MSAIGTAVPAANHRWRLARQLAIVVTITKFITLVANAGLSLPKTVGNIAGINASWHTAITISCQTILVEGFLGGI